jgi:preprotein translocase subunit SecE
MARERSTPAWKRALRFLREVRDELAKVLWPTRKELLTYTFVVLVTVVLLGAFVYGLDVGFSFLTSRLFVDRP